MTVPHPAPAAVIGGGVAGLTTALELASRGYAATLFADRRGLKPASLVAPALFTPYPGPDESRFCRWTEHSFSTLADLARKHGPASGITLGDLREYCYEPQPHRPWLDRLLNAHPIRPLPPAIAHASSTTRPHMDMLRYVPWLEARAAAAGIRFVDRRVASIDELFSEGFTILFNCSGLGARSLAADGLLKPLHGQVLHVPNDIGLTYSLHDDSPGGQVAYIFTFNDRLVLGGTFDEGPEHDLADEASLAGIIDRCRNLLRLDGHPRWNDLARTRIRALAAARPTRGPAGHYEHARVEREDLPLGRVVIHNYGHGRTGASLTWGTAHEAVNLAFSRPAAG